MGIIFAGMVMGVARQSWLNLAAANEVQMSRCDGSVGWKSDEWPYEPAFFE
jgi:hypothetical protein